MRIHRDQSRLSFRKRSRRRTGCLSWTLLLGLVVGMGVISWNWLGSRLQFTAQPVESDDLAAGLDTFARGDLDGTIAYARKALEQNPDNTDALTLLVRALIYRSYTDYNRAVDRTSALELTQEALAHDGSSPAIMALHAYALQAAGQPVEAARMAQQVLNRDPNNTLARIANALAYGGVGSLNIALRESQQAVQQPGWQLESWRALATSYSDLGDYSNAIQAIEQALKLNHYLITLYFERALYALQIGDADSATAAYYQILTYDPNNVKVRLRLCELSSTLRERDEAVQYCEDVTQRAPSWAVGINWAWNAFCRAISKTQKQRCTAALHCKPCRMSP
jgi:tetratricopeptide (TPR) repeat protein